MVAMIIVHGIIPIKPSRRDEALDLARAMAEATQAEAGCISYEFYVGLRDPNTLILLQEWESAQALTGHFRTKHTRVFLDELPKVLAGDVLTRRYAVQNAASSDSPDAAASRKPAPRDEEPPIIH